MVLVPMDTPGVEVIRNIPVMNHLSPEGHCEIVYRNVRVPLANLLHEEGAGFAIAQARLGPGRIHHCMRTIGQGEVALELMCDRAAERKTFGRFLHQHANIAEWIALSRIEIEQARLLVLKAAWMIDRHGAKDAAREIAMIKALVPRMQTAVCERAMQVHGAMGLSPDTPLPLLWLWGRVLHRRRARRGAPALRRAPGDEVRASAARRAHPLPDATRNACPAALTAVPGSPRRVRSGHQTPALLGHHHIARAEQFGAGRARVALA